MKITVHKVIFAWNYDKEEKWLNEMSRKGYQLCEVSGFRYVFQEGEPNEYIYRLELLENLPKHPESVEYIRFMEEVGAEHVASVFRWCYFRRKSELGEFNLYSDAESKIKHLNQILVLVGAISIGNGLNGICQLIGWGLSHSAMQLYGGLIILAMTAPLMYGTVYLYKKKEQLKKQKILFD